MIYFAHAVGTDLVKIGFTAGEPAKRLKELQTGCAQRLELLAAVEGTVADEAECHRKFAHLRQQGEWFRFAPELAVFIATRGQGINDNSRIEIWDLASWVAKLERELESAQLQIASFNRLP